jgi:hypothetical protein
MEILGNDPWRLRLTSTSQVPPASSWPVLASGGIAVVPMAASDSIDTQATQLLSKGKSKDMTPTFLVGRVTVTNEPMALDSVEWDMRTATLSARYDALDESGMVLEHEQRVLLSLPNVLLHTVRIRGSGSGSARLAAASIRQEVRLPWHSAAAFSGILLPGTTSVAIESASSTSTAITVFVPAATTTALWGPPNVSEPSQSGSSSRRAFVDVALRNVDANDIVGGVSLHVITAFFDKAEAEPEQMRRFAASLASLSPDSVQAFVDKHEAMWANRWGTFVDVPSASARIRLALVTAAYNMHACSAGSLDVSGSTYAQGLEEDAVVPAQVLMAPLAARESLDRRQSDADSARSAARMRGLDGRLDAYGPAEKPQVLRWFSKPSVAQAQAQSVTVTVTRMFGTLMTGINAWNYFRVSHDRAWLVETGYGMLEACADMVASLVASSPDGQRLVGAASIADASASDTIVVDEALCVAASAAVMRAAFEASYLLGYEPSASWTAARYALSLPMMVVSGGSGARVIARCEGDSDALPPELPLAVLNEPLGTLAESELAVNIAANIVVNQATWSALASAADDAGLTWGDDVMQATRKLIRLQALARAMQVDASLSSSFLAELDAFLDAHMDAGGFGGLMMPNDLGVSARLLLVFLCGLGGATVCGGVGESGSVYASFGVNLASSAVLPATWDRMQVHGLGPSRIDAILLNRSLYGGGGMGGGSPYGSSNLVYWSTDSLIL